MRKEYSIAEIAAYYRITRDHYKRGWELEDSLAMHYGYWDKDVKTHLESLRKLNMELAYFGQISEGSRVLDAGCGVGGSSIFLAKEYFCFVEGITIEEGQLKDSISNAQKNRVEDKVVFSNQDFTSTNFPDNHFDFVWGIESIIHSTCKVDFFQEAFRILKPGGKLIVADYFAKNEIIDDELEVLLKWLNPWAITTIETEENYLTGLKSVGFSNVTIKNINSYVTKSSKRMYFYSYYLGILTFFYSLIHPNMTDYSRNHFKAMYHQYKAFKKGLWNYNFLSALKPVEKS